MSRLSGALGALQGLEKGMIGRDQAKSQLAQTLFDLRKYQEITLPESQAQVAESGARTELYRTQVAGVGLMQKRSQFEYNQAIETYNELKKLEKKYGGRLDLEQPFAQARQLIAEAQNKAEEAKKGEEIGLPGTRAVTEKEELTQRGLIAAAGAEAERKFADVGGAALTAEERRVSLEAKIQKAPIDIEQASQEMRQAQLTTQFMEADTPTKIANIPLTQRLLQTQVAQAQQNLSVSKSYDMQQAQANLASTQENTARTKQEIRRIDTEMKDKVVLDGIATNSGLTNPITNKPVTTWEEYRLVMDFKLDEQLAMVRAISSGGSGYPTMAQVVKQITVAQDATLFGRPIPHKSENMVNNFISYIPFFLASGQDPNAAWAIAKMSYMALSSDAMSQRDLVGYLPADMVVSDEQTQRVTTAIQQALSEQARTSAAGGTIPPPTITGPPTGIAPGATKRPPGLREQVAGAPGSVTESQTFGLDSATRIKIGNIIDFHRNDPDLQDRLIKEIAKEKDMNKRDQMSRFAEYYFETKR